MLKKWISLAVCGILLTAVLGASAAAGAPAQESDGYVVRFREGFSGSTEGMTKIHENLYQLNDKSLLRGLGSDVESIERNVIVEAPEFVGEPEFIGEDSVVPASLPWQVSMVNPDFVWNHNTYGESVKVAVIDSGCCRHKQLETVLCGGRNFVSHNDDYSDANGHGTNVAGILAASAGSWVTGIAPKVELYALRCWEEGKTTTIAVIEEAIYAAVDQFGCQIINMSFQTSTDSSTIHEALIYARQKGAILIASSGNTGDDVPGYPGAYPEVICVASVGREKTASEFSCWNGNVLWRHPASPTSAVIPPMPSCP